ncbi:Nucleoporin nup84 [Tulasnella sp. 427]|nr:Nucleoporin nup84 [Tulasnella sp. 427]
MQSSNTQGWQGNKRRKLWREACLQAAASPTYPPATRALYAALCLTPRSIPAVTPLLNTWEDHLWARTEMLVSERIADWLDHLGGFWENGMKPSDPQSSSKLHDLPNEGQWWTDVDKIVREMENVRVTEGTGGENPFHFAQLHLVLGNINGLLELVASTCRTRQEQEETPSRDWNLVVRFFVHLSLFLRTIREDIPTSAVDTILNEYIRHLEMDPASSSLVALYVGALGESAVEKYASYLARLDVHLPQTERESALKGCEKHGLDVAQVAIMAASIAARTILAVMPPAKGPLPDPSSGPAHITENEHGLLRSLDWLLYTGRTRDEALAQANNLIRYFLGIGRPVAARSTMDIVSQSLIRKKREVGEFASFQATEFHCYQQYVSLVDALDKVPTPETYPTGESATKRSAWKDEYLRAIDDAWNQGLDLLTHSWLENDALSPLQEPELEELRRVRSIHLPDIVIRLNYILLSSREHSQGNLDRAMELVAIVAEERYFIYPTFIAFGGNRLGEYLDGVRQVGLALLEVGRSPNDLFPSYDGSYADDLDCLAVAIVADLSTLFLKLPNAIWPWFLVRSHADPDTPKASNPFSSSITMHITPPSTPASSMKTLTTRRLRILAPRVFDSISCIFLVNQAITISRVTGLIINVRPIATLEDLFEDGKLDVIDLREENITLIPGLIDTHVHMFLHPYSETSWTDQVTRESTAERVIRATVHARKTLMAGYTTVRDLGTEGAEDSDVALRKCLSGPKGDLHPGVEGVDGKRGAEVADGEAECIRAVRRQVGAGANWIKIYADYPIRSRLNVVSPRMAARDLPLFTRRELSTMIETAHALGVKVAAHASRPETCRLLVDVGIDSIEHGLFMDKEALLAIKNSPQRVIWTPTLATFAEDGPYSQFMRFSKKSFQEALRIGGIRFGCGGDTGTFAHGLNASELLTMIDYGADWRDVLKWATIGGWECVRGIQWEGEAGHQRLDAFEKAAAKGYVDGSGVAEGEIESFEDIGEWPLGDNDVPLGAIKVGFAADIVGIGGDLMMDGKDALLKAFSKMADPFHPPLVIKAGRVCKLNGQELV